ncbi:hypothetical protein CBS9595_003379 [Malassezia furfur]|nr:hypothetical protein CBS9595_003379 [Malassezia furfur]
MTVFQLIPGVQSYDWGVPGGDKHSICADLAEATCQLQFERKADKPYAELRKDPQLIGSAVVDKYGVPEDGALPFLFKVLSIAKALSIQAHPDKKLAERLHAEKPSMYKDANHKPEMAIAINAFEGFCGFRPVREIAQFVHRVPELREAMGADDALQAELDEAARVQDAQWDAGQSGNEPRVHDALKRAFAALMHCQAATYERMVVQLAERYQAALDRGEALEVSDEVARLVVRLNTQYPKDIGVLCTYLLNIVHLEQGQAIFLGADEPHAYLSGQILECMAASDNVVRAGLTPKARDVEVLVDMLTYQSARAADQLLRAEKWEGDSAQPNPSLLYDPPIDEFSVLVTILEKDAKRSEQRGVQGPSVVLAYEGTGTLHADGTTYALRPGIVLYVAAGTPIALSTDDRLLVARAFLELTP